MSRRFTLIPTNLLEASAELLARAARDPAVVVEVERDTVLYFAGTEAVAPYAIGGACLGCLRIDGSGVFHVDAEGYEGSIEHLAVYLRWLLSQHACRVIDDDTGRELTNEAITALDALLELRKTPASSRS